MPSFSPSDYARGLLRFLQVKPEFDKELWDASVKEVIDTMPYATNMTFDEAVEDAILNVGNRFVSGYWSKYARKTNTKNEALRNPECLQEIRNRIREGRFTPFTMSLKDELLKPGKIARTFLPIGLDVLVACRMVYGNFLVAMQAESPAGINYAAKDYAYVIDQMGQNLFGKNMRQGSSDASGADTSIKSDHKEPVYRHRDDHIINGDYGLGPDFDAEAFRLALREFLCEPVVHYFDGMLVRIQGNPSGNFLTICDNSIIFRVVHVYTYKLIQRDFPDFEPVKYCVFVTGDDSDWGMDDDLFDLYMEYYKKASQQLGFKIGDFEFNKNIEYCGFRFRKIGGLWRRVAAHPQRVFDALFYSSVVDYNETCAIVQSLLGNYWWDMDVRHELQLFRAYLCKPEVREPYESFSWQSDSQLELSNSITPLKAEASVNRSTGKTSSRFYERNMAPKKNNNKNNKSGKKASASSGLSQQERIAINRASAMSERMVSMSEFGHQAPLIRKYSAFIMDPNSHRGVNGPANGLRAAQPRTLPLDITLSGSDNAKVYDVLVAIDCRRTQIHQFIKNVTDGGNFVYSGSEPLSNYLSVSEYNDFRVLACRMTASNETHDAGSSVVSGHLMSAQLTGVDSWDNLSESVIRKRAYFGVVEGAGSLDPVTDFFIPTQQSTIPRPASGNGSISSGADHVLSFDNSTVGHPRSFDDSVGNGFFILDVNIDNPEVSVSAGVHHMPLKYTGPVRIQGWLRSDSGGATNEVITYVIYRLSPIDGTEFQADVGTLTTVAGSGAFLTTLDTRDDTDGMISRITLANSSGAAMNSIVGNIRLVFEEGDDDASDVLLLGAYGVSGAQSVRFKGTLALDAEPNEERYLEQPPPPCLLTMGEFALAVRPFLMSTSSAGALTFREALHGAAKFGRGALKVGKTVGQVAEKLAVLGVL